MCTAISMKGKNHYFGRNLDLTHHYAESVTIMPRKYCLKFRNGQMIDSHYGMIGVATIVDKYPLYYDAVNEWGLSACALNFPGNAAYFEPSSNRINISSFELIPWILSQHRSLASITDALQSLNITNLTFSPEYPATPLHWLIADSENTIVIEQTETLRYSYETPVHVLTNNPPLLYHLQNLSNYINVTAHEAVNRFAESVNLQQYSIGMGGIGLPGDLSSASRFVRAAFQLHNSVCAEHPDSQINQFFHILKSVEQTEGCAEVNGEWEKTIYSSCCDTNNGIYYYTTYQNSRITCVNMHKENLDSQTLISYPLRIESDFFKEN